MKTKSWLVMFALSLLPGCQAADHHDIYIVGNEGSWSRPFLWHENVRTDLVSEEGSFHARANDILLDGDDVIIAGSYKNQACLWVNGEMKVIDDPGGVSAMVMHESDLYLAGAYDGGPVYWQGDNRFELDLATELFEVTGITVENGEVYVSGAWSDMGPSPKQTACYWHNGDRIDLSDGTEGVFYSTSGIAVEGGKIVVSGYYHNMATGGENVACYWQNGARTDIGGRYTTGLTTSDGHIYMSGKDENGDPCYWKDESINSLEVNGSGTTSDIQVVGGDVITVGEYGYTNDVDNACYWIDGERTEVLSGDQIGFSAVFVAE